MYTFNLTQAVVQRNKILWPKGQIKRTFEHMFRRKHLKCCFCVCYQTVKLPQNLRFSKRGVLIIWTTVWTYELILNGSSWYQYRILLSIIFIKIKTWVQPFKYIKWMWVFSIGTKPIILLTLNILLNHSFNSGWMQK